MGGECDKQAIIDDLESKEELDPDKHDGCYRLMRETVAAYARLGDLSIVDYRDLNLLYLTTVLTLRHGIESKKKSVMESNLPTHEKERLCSLWDETWASANKGEYDNAEPGAKGKPTIGLFGTGFMSFRRRGIPRERIRDLLGVFVAILPMSDDEQMFECVGKVLDSPIPGLQAGSASMMLHCLKPFTFPIFNGNMGNENVFAALGVKLERPSSLETYIDNCRRVKEFRDSNFSCKNYRIFDMESWDYMEAFRMSSNGHANSDMPSRRGWLLTWNRAKWEWDGYNDACLDTMRGIPFSDSWSCSSKAPKVGDEVFLLKLGAAPKGLIGHGIVRRGSYEAPHYDSAQAAEGKTRRCIDVEFDRLIDCDKDRIVTQEELVEKCATQNWSPMSSGIEIKEGVLPTVRLLWESVVGTEARFGLKEIVSFLRDYAGTRYTAPDKAGENADQMAEMKRRGQDARQRFIAFGRKVAERVPGLSFSHCSGWMNQGQVVPRYLWIELKDERWGDAPQSVSMNIEPHDDEAYPGEGYYLSVRAELNDAHATEDDYARQLRLLGCNLSEGMTYRVSHRDGSYHGLGRDAGRVRSLRGEGTLLKLSVIEAIEDPAGKDEDGTFLAETVRACVEIRKLYEHVMDDAKDDRWPSDGLEEADEDMAAFGRNTILYGPPGTGKTYNSVVWAVAICEGRSVEEVMAEDYIAVHSRYEKLREEGRVVFTTFHQSYGYEEFVEGIRPVMADDDQGGLQYVIRDGVFKRLCESARGPRARSTSGTPLKEKPRPYVLIVDEINRGNISKVFGELITLIEDTKRSGGPEAMEAVLPYSGEVFSVPDNIYILGTMNTADRSIALMDTALRRRFEFVEMMPDPEVLRKLEADVVKADGESLDVATMLDVMNKRVECLYDREHTIGHAFFTSLQKSPTIETLAGIFLKDVIPLLQEYFYDDWEKIQLVLGDNAKEDALKFVLDKVLKPRDVFLGNPDVDLPEKAYSIQTDAFFKIQSYKQIGAGL